MNEQGRLLVRAKPEKDESFMGFVLRLTDINTFTSPFWILERLGDYQDALHAGCSFVLGAQMNLVPLSELTGVDEKELESLRYPPVRVNSHFDEHWFHGSAVSIYMLRMRHPKVCPACLKQANYCRNVWDLAPATVCAIHSCLLLDECPNCQKKRTRSNFIIQNALNKSCHIELTPRELLSNCGKLY